MGRVFGWGPAALWAAVLFLLSDLPALSVGLPSGADKLAHGAVYLILGLSLAWGKVRTGSRVGWVVLLLIGAGYGALDEWHQSFVLGRQATVGDWMADGAGVMLGLVLFSRFRSRSRDNGRPASEDTAKTA